jgi:hypothetical protein
MQMNTEEYFYFPHLVVWGRYCACEILIANPIDWLYAACLEYFIFLSIDSSEARKQYDEYCLSIMQTITYAHFESVTSLIIFHNVDLFLYVFCVVQNVRGINFSSVSTTFY